MKTLVSASDAVSCSAMVESQPSLAAVQVLDGVCGILLAAPANELDAMALLRQLYAENPAYETSLKLLGGKPRKFFKAFGKGRVEWLTVPAENTGGPLLPILQLVAVKQQKVDFPLASQVPLSPAPGDGSNFAPTVPQVERDLEDRHGGTFSWHSWFGVYNLI